jgi:hypothetical protein
MSLFPFRNGKSVVWDFTCVDTYASSNLLNSATEAGSAATHAEERKRAKYADISIKHIFEPVAVETTGVYGESSREFIRELGRRMTEATDDCREHTWLRQRIGIAVVRDNALSITLASGTGSAFLV